MKTDKWELAPFPPRKISISDTRVLEGELSRVSLEVVTNPHPKAVPLHSLESLTEAAAVRQYGWQICSYFFNITSFDSKTSNDIKSRFLPPDSLNNKDTTLIDQVIKVTGGATGVDDRLHLVQPVAIGATNSRLLSYIDRLFGLQTYARTRKNLHLSLDCRGEKCLFIETPYADEIEIDKLLDLPADFYQLPEKFFHDLEPAIIDEKQWADIGELANTLYARSVEVTIHS